MLLNLYSSYNMNQFSNWWKLTAWIKAEETNFCGVDWSGLASDDYYHAAMKHVKTVGRKISEFLATLKRLNGQVNTISIAGHSLGAHVSGFAGKTFFESERTKINNIYGLDPAGPLFTLSIFLPQSDFVLSPKCANFVQVLHTTSTLGTNENIGHADFIVNGGNVQGACVDELVTAKDFSKGTNLFCVEGFVISTFSFQS